MMVKTKFARKNPGDAGPKTRKLHVAKRAKLRVPWKSKARRLSPDSDSDSDDQGACAQGMKRVSFSTKAGPVSFCASSTPKKRTGSKFFAMRKPRKKDYGKRISRQLVDASGATQFVTDETDPWGLRS